MRERGAYLRDLFLVKLTEHSLLCILFPHFTVLTFPKMWFSQKKLFLLIDCRYIWVFPVPISC